MSFLDVISKMLSFFLFQGIQGKRLFNLDHACLKFKLIFFAEAVIFHLCGLNFYTVLNESVEKSMA